MTLRAILRWPDQRLSQRCDEVAEGAIVDGLVADMFETMYDAPGRGLAAPQVGVMQRIFVMDVTWKDGAPTPLAFINPVVLSRSDRVVGTEEGCLSIPGLSVLVKRADQVDVAWRDLAGAPRRQVFAGFAAACVQHEIDHLDGIVTLDHLTGPARERALVTYADPGS